MSKGPCLVLLSALLFSGSAFSSDLSTTSEFEQQLMLLDRISYHPSLLPLIMQNIDYLELTPEQQNSLEVWRTNNAPDMLEKMRAVAQGRIDFIDASLNPDSTNKELVQRQHALFRLQEEVLLYKLACRQNILDTFTPEQWDALLFIVADRQLEAIH